MEGRKKEIIFLYCGLRTGNFGAGSHFYALLDGLSKSGNFKIKMIRTDSQLYREVTVNSYGNIPVLDIPQPENKLFLTVEDSLIQKTYAKRVLEISYPFFEDFEDPFFVVNSIDYLNLVLEMKGSLEACSIAYIHHAWSWKDFYNKPDRIFMEDWDTLNTPRLEQAMYYTKQQQKLALLADKVVAVTDQARDFFVKHLGVAQNKVFKIYNGLDMDKLQGIDGIISPSDYGLGSSEKAILYCGRIKSEKGVGALIEAFKIIHKTHPDYRLVLIGSGDFKEMISKTNPISAKVTFTGKLSREELFKWYGMASVGVLPSFHEQCSFTALEMAAHRLPMVISAVDGLGEMYHDGLDSLKVQVGFDKDGFKTISPQTLAEKIITLVQNPELATQLAQNAFRLVSEKYTLDNMIRGYIEVFQTESHEIY